MGEAVPSGRNFGHETGATRLLQSVEKRFVAKSPGRLNYSQVELSTHDGRHPKGLVGVPGKARHPATDDVPDALGDAELLDWTPCHPAPLQLAQPAGLRQMADDLEHEEGIALRLGMDGPSQNHGVISVELVTGRLPLVAGVVGLLDAILAVVVVPLARGAFRSPHARAYA